jgi:hypothetical protein
MRAGGDRLAEPCRHAVADADPPESAEQGVVPRPEGPGEKGNGAKGIGPKYPGPKGQGKMPPRRQGNSPLTDRRDIGDSGDDS